MVITIQTDGATNFERPVPVCFPSLKNLPPGTRRFLVSFNHDLGSWEPVGPMTVTDDVQVRNVEFYVDGQLVFTDGSYPFEYRFAALVRTATKTTFALKSRATDTGGNATWSNELIYTLTPVTTGPAVVDSLPRQGRLGVNVDTVSIIFNEAILAPRGKGDFALLNADTNAVTEFNSLEVSDRASSCASPHRSRPETTTSESSQTASPTSPATNSPPSTTSSLPPAPVYRQTRCIGTPSPATGTIPPTGQAAASRVRRIP